MKKITICMVLLLAIGVFLTACNGGADASDNGKLKVVTTTTIIADVLKQLSGDLVDVQALMGPGVDPHLYKASAGDVKRMTGADMVVYNGLDLEGKMGDVFKNIKGKIIFAVTEDLDESRLLDFESNPGFFDPHVWFDVKIWKETTQRMAQGLKELDPKNAEVYDKNLEKYLSELDELDRYVKDREIGRAHV